MKKIKNSQKKSRGGGAIDDVGPATEKNKGILRAFIIKINHVK